MNLPRTVGLGLMCKPPRPGTTKTRLAASIGADAAARLSRAFLTDCAAAVVDAAREVPLDHAAFYRPADAKDEISTVLGPAWQLTFADSGELGATMLDVLGGLLVHAAGGAMVMGADVPMISPSSIADAARRLGEGDARRVVIMPTRDGGYCLIGIRSAEVAASLFAPMVWSTGDVFNETQRRARDAGLDFVVLPAHRDIDEEADLDWIKEELLRRSELCPATRAALSSLDAEARRG